MARDNYPEMYIVSLFYFKFIWYNVRMQCAVQTGKDAKVRACSCGTKKCNNEREKWSYWTI